jgi:tetratricopeptide (TPR) repeat protein
MSQATGSVVQHAPDAAYELPAPSKCTVSDLSATPALPTSPALRERVLAAERAVARVSALVTAGADLRAEELAERTLPEVRAIPYPRAEAKLLSLEGKAKQGRGDSSAALAAYHAALNVALRVGDDSLACRAAAVEAFILSAYLNKPQEAVRWIDLAEALAERAGHDDATDAAVIHSRQAVLGGLGRSKEAGELLDREIALLERAYGARDPRVASAIGNRGLNELTLGQYDRAARDLGSAVEVLAAATGPNNPHLDTYHLNVGYALWASGRPAEAKPVFEHALTLQAGRPPGTITVAIYASLAEVDVDLGDSDGAIRAADEGVEVAKTASGAEMFKWEALVARANARAYKGDEAGKTADCARVFAEQRAQGTVAPDRPYHPDALRCLGEAELAAHRTAAAIEYFEQGVALEHRILKADLPLAKFALARALGAAGQSPERARTLAESAREGLVHEPGKQKELAAIEAWLKEPAVAQRRP